MSLAVNTQENNSLLINKNFIAKIGSICEETTDGYDCAGIEIYLILNFTKEDLSITEKQISSCGTENITFKLDYKWELTPQSEIKIGVDSTEITSNFFKNIVLKFENKTVIGYINNTEIEFEKIVKE